jgi:hypothetical protein
MIRMRNAFRDLTEKSAEKIPHGRPRRRLKDNIKMYLTKDTDKLVAIVNMVMYLRVQ